MLIRKRLEFETRRARRQFVGDRLAATILHQELRHLCQYRIDVRIAKWGSHDVDINRY